MTQYTITNRPAPIAFECGDDITVRTLQNAKNLLMCRMGEVPYDRYRGFDPALYDLPLAELKAKLLPELDRVMLWEPDAEVVDADCALDEQGEVLITATIDVTIDE
jgi:hypothetical protein